MVVLLRIFNAIAEYGMEGFISPGLRRRDLWLKVLKARGIAGGTPEETVLIAAEFEEMRPATFRANLSRGFSPKYHDALRSIVSAVDADFDPSLWLEKTTELRASKAQGNLAWALPETLDASTLYKQLETIYAQATTYECLRVGGAMTRTRTRFIRDTDDLAKKPDPEFTPVRLSYLKILWARILSRELAGRSVHMIRSVARLVELWATVSLIQEAGLCSENQITLLTSEPTGPNGYEPVMGVRIIDSTTVLFSSPSFEARPGFNAAVRSNYSGWIQSGRLASFASEYVNRARAPGTDLTAASTVELENAFERAYARLSKKDADATVTNYGRLDQFWKLNEVRRRMLGWAKPNQEVWMPVIA